jgi:hypothetical protein
MKLCRAQNREVPKRQPPELVDESAESEITIQPDGRVFAFGITGPLATVLAAIPTADARSRRLLERITSLQAASHGRDCSRPTNEEGPPCLNP